MWRARRFLARLSAFLRRGPAERDLAREVAANLALMEDDFRARGMSPAGARLAARRAYGGVAQAMEIHRDARSFVWLEQAFQDVRHAVRGLRKSPRFVAVALLSLCFGIGVNTAIFTLVHGVLLKQLPVPNPDRVVQIKAQFKDFAGTGFSYPVFRELRRQDAIFADVIGFSNRPAAIEEGETRRPVLLQMVTGSYFSLLGGQPALGRWIEEEDDRVEGSRRVCVVSYEQWQSSFAGDPQILGRSVRIAGTPFQVIGVAPPGFAGADMQRRNDVWVPTAMIASIAKNPRETPTWVWLHVLARLKPGLSFSEAASRMEAASPGIEEALPKARANRGAVYRIFDASRGFDSWRTSLREPLLVLMGAVTLVLLVACANLANLLLARAGERQQEFAIKLSLGVSRWRLLRQLLAETFAVTLAGGMLGTALAVSLTRYLLLLFNSGSRQLTSLHVEPDLGVLLYTFAGCVVTALIAGIYPAWQASRTDLAQRLVSAAQARRAIVRRALILVQVTLTVVLLFGASLFTHSLRNLKLTNLGYDIDHVLTVELQDNTPGRKSRRVKSSPELAEVLSRVRGLPAVESAAYSQPGPLASGMMSTDVDVVNEVGNKRHVENVGIMFASPGFLSTLRIPLLRGRDFNAADRDGAPGVLLVNERLASMAWPGENPIGKRMNGWNLQNAEIVGVVGNSHYQAVREDTIPTAYEPFDQEAVEGGFLQIRYRGSGPPVERDVRRIVREAAPKYVVTQAAAMSLMRDGHIARDRLLAFLSSIFGALGTALSLVGIYGLISYSVTRRTREVGIRMSIGAQRRDVLWLFVRESVALIGAGVVFGLPLAIVLARFIRKMLYQVSINEPGDIAITLVLVAAGGLAAAYLPGRRATRIDPVRALRHD
jgi:predicted permease